MLALIALVARADATPSAVALAIQYANAMTGDPDAPAIQPAARTAEDDDSIDADEADVDSSSADASAADNAAPTADDDQTLGQRTLGEHAGELVLDDDLAGSSALTSDELGYSSPPAGAAESYEARLRRRRTSLLGRLDLALSWRQHASAPMHSPAHLDHELWLLATWRR